jgi:glutamate dehydrogenase
MRTFWEQIEQLDSEVEAQIQLEMLIEGRRLVERATRWLARANPRQIDIEVTMRFFKPGAKLLGKALPDVLDSSDRWTYATRVDELGGSGVPLELAERVAAMPWLLPTFDVVEVARAAEWPLGAVLETYFRLGSGIELNWLRDRIIELPRANRWQALARSALRDDLSSLHRALTQEVLQAGGRNADADTAIETWKNAHAAAIERATAIIDDIKGSRTYDTTTLPVALREIRNLIRGGVANEGVPGAESVTMAG